MTVKIPARNVLIDIDNTLAYERNDYVKNGIPGGANYPQMICARMLSERQDITFEEALEKLIRAEKPCGRMDSFFAVRTHPAWGISNKAFWDACIRWQNQHFFFYKDAVFMIKELKRRRFHLLTASNNGSLGVLLKLAREGFATSKGSKYFSFLFGDDLTGCQKGNPDYFREVIKQAKIDPKESVMIGDNVEQDFCTAKQAGFETVILVNRKMKKRMVPGTPIIVNTLKAVADMLVLRP